MPVTYYGASEEAAAGRPVEQQLVVAYLAILGGIGTAGVPAGSIPFVILLLVSIGVNPGMIAIILGVDRILDMSRTVPNVSADILTTIVVARSEGMELVPATAPDFSSEAAEEVDREEEDLVGTAGGGGPA